MTQQIRDTEFVLFDTETTGLDPASGDRVVEIAALRVRDGRVLGSFESLMNPGRPVSEGAFRVNHISQEMLDPAPAPEEVLRKFMAFAGNACLCTYNAPFDMGFLSSELELISYPLDPSLQVVDVLAMARKLLPGLNRYALWSVAEHLGMQLSQLHRAAADVEMTLSVFLSLVRTAEEKGIADLAAFTSLFGWRSQHRKEKDEEKLSQIQRAIDQQAVVRIRYFSRSSSQLSERNVLPQEIKREQGRPYLVAHCMLKNDRRVFSVDNILHVEMA